MAVRVRFDAPCSQRWSYAVQQVRLPHGSSRPRVARRRHAARGQGRARLGHPLSRRVAADAQARLARRAAGIALCACRRHHRAPLTLSNCGRHVARLARRECAVRAHQGADRCPHPVAGLRADRRSRASTSRITSSHGDFALIWACLPDDLRERTRPVAGADYWLKGKLRKYIAEHVIRAVLIDRNRETRTRGSDPADGRGDRARRFADRVPRGHAQHDRRRRCCRSRAASTTWPRACPDVEFVPVWIENVRRVMPKGKLLPVPLLCTLTVGAPIKLAAGRGPRCVRRPRTRNALLALHAARAMTAATANRYRCSPASARCSSSRRSSAMR